MRSTAANIARQELPMRKWYIVVLAVINIHTISCSSVKKIDRFELIRRERMGYSISVDSIPVKLSMTYLNNANISDVRIDKKRKKVNVHRKNVNALFYSISDIRNQSDYKGTIDLISVDGLVLDSAMVQKARFEDGSVRYIRLLTQKDYDRKEFDDLPLVKQSVGNGILIIKTQ